MTNEELAWAAGFFDGEGCFTNSHDRRRSYVVCRPTACITQKDCQILGKFARIVGMGKIYLHMSGWQWTLARWADVEWLMCLLWPWLSIVKREQATRVMAEFYALQDRRLG